MLFIYAFDTAGRVRSVCMAASWPKSMEAPALHCHSHVCTKCRACVACPATLRVCVVLVMVCMPGCLLLIAWLGVPSGREQWPASSARDLPDNSELTILAQTQLDWQYRINIKVQSAGANCWS
jgi:hypothetical protein